MLAHSPRQHLPAPCARQDKESKLAYLNKIVKCVQYALDTTIEIRCFLLLFSSPPHPMDGAREVLTREPLLRCCGRASKVVAGLEPENTNVFLQMLAQAATTVSESDSSAAVAKVLAETGGAGPAPSAEAAPPPPPPPAEPAAPPPPPPPPMSDPASAPVAPAAPAPVAPPAEGALQQMTSAPMKKPEEEQLPAAADEPKPERPRTARRAPPKLASNEVKVDKAQQQKEAAPVSGVILEGAGAQEDDDTIMMVDNQGAHRHEPARRAASGLRARVGPRRAALRGPVCARGGRLRRRWLVCTGGVRARDPTEA